MTIRANNHSNLLYVRANGNMLKLVRANNHVVWEKYPGAKSANLSTDTLSSTLHASVTGCDVWFRNVKFTGINNNTPVVSGNTCNLYEYSCDCEIRATIPPGDLGKSTPWRNILVAGFNVSDSDWTGVPDNAVVYRADFSGSATIDLGIYNHSIIGGVSTKGSRIRTAHFNVWWLWEQYDVYMNRFYDCTDSNPTLKFYIYPNKESDGTSLNNTVYIDNDSQTHATSAWTLQTTCNILLARPVGVF